MTLDENLYYELHSPGNGLFILKQADIKKQLQNKNTNKTNNSKKPNRKISSFGTKEYNDSMQRAFNRVKQQVFFNPDMIYFVTLTYKGLDHTSDDVLRDLKIFMKKQRRRGFDPKYVAVMEYQKRGSIHVHMITNEQFNITTNKNGYFHLPDWQHGFSSVLSIDKFDENFRAYLYLFKYMKKAARIGNNFVYASRNLNNSVKYPLDMFDIRLYHLIAEEKTQAILPNGKPINYTKYYLQQKEEFDT